ncbi:PAS domain-containing sensor histidine kinase [Sorangium sp. So ce394]|uniref:sensor histidine kinase n=1 Tax=Sorangium sp. So ce394 TaxID=3133310 RepID=UPI003F5C8811
MRTGTDDHTEPGSLVVDHARHPGLGGPAPSERAESADLGPHGAASGCPPEQRTDDLGTTTASPASGRRSRSNTVAIDIPTDIARKWQEMTDLLAEILRVPAALIMRVEPPEIVVCVSSESKGNPYEPNERARLDTGLYCETVMKTRTPLLVPDALKDEQWESSPDVKLGMISYLGFPIAWPTGDIFGTICVLDDRANQYSKTYQTLVAQCRDVIEVDLKSIFAFEARLTEEARAKERLEQQVAERTAELSHANAQLRRKIAEHERTEAALRKVAEERRRAEEALRTSQELLRAIIDSSTTVVSVKDIEGRYILVNRRFEELFGVAREAIVGKSDYDVFSREHAEALCAFDQRAILAGTALEDEEVMPHDDGVHTYLAIKFPLRDAAGVPYAVGGISTDITERKKIEAERALLLEEEQRARAAAEAAVRMRDDFVSIASHELYTPIAGLKLAVQGLMREATALPAGAQRLAGMAERQCRRLVRLIEDLLNVARIQAGKLELKLEDVDLRALSREVVEDFDVELKQSGSTVTWRADAPVVGLWDRARLEQVVTNLVLNAIKYGRGKPIEISVAADGEMAKLVVADRGIGIDASCVPYIFERFERGVSAQHYGGLGLGLYISRRIVDAHGGSIRVESELGAGAAFIVDLPLRRRRHALPTEVSPPAGGPDEPAG